jgi:hypothetical protein
MPVPDLRLLARWLTGFAAGLAFLAVGLALFLLILLLLILLLLILLLLVVLLLQVLVSIALIRAAI